MRRLSAILALSLFAAGAGAQGTDYAARADDLVALSRILGELHAIRRQCAQNREADVWRERMRKLVELEMPQQAQRDRMVAAFNEGFSGAESAFPTCDRDARNHAARTAAEGDNITRRLVEPLYAAGNLENNR
jgi:uncharacterized protein (TIGR02301 family)